MNLPYILNIQKYSIHDGPGIRTTIFFKGCLLSCIWCHNPESQSYEREFMYNAEICKQCMVCLNTCPEHAIEQDERKIKTNREKCKKCEICVDNCASNARELVGKRYTVSQLIEEIEKDRIFYDETYGGVTLSGGEVMTQNMDFIEELLKKLKKRGYNVAIDTCGHANTKNYEIVLPYTDVFLYDIKLIDWEKHKLYMGKGNELILKNLKLISDLKAKINIRIPIIGNVNDDDNSIMDIINYLKNNINVTKINILPYHKIGSDKYERLDMEYLGKNLFRPSDERLEKIKKYFIENGFNDVKIGG